MTDIKDINELEQNENIDDFKREIEEQLTDDKQKNIEFLQTKIGELLSNFNKNIKKISILRNYITKNIDEEILNKYSEYDTDFSQTTNDKIAEATKYIKIEDFDKAKEILQNVVNYYDDVLSVIYSGKEKYFDFADLKEMILFKDKTNPDFSFEWVISNISTAYYLLGYIGISESDYDNARKYLKKSIEHNPISNRARYELLEIHKYTKDYGEEFFKLLDETYENIFDCDDLAKYYRDLSYYYVDVDKHLLAVVLLLYSTKFQESDFAFKEFDYIMQTTGMTLENIPKDPLQYMIDNGIKIYMSEENVGILVDILKDESLDRFRAIKEDIMNDLKIILDLDFDENSNNDDDKADNDKDGNDDETDD